MRSGRLLGISNPIFVVGVPRSGTTLLQCMLSANKGAFSLPETHFFCSVLRVLKLQAEDRLNRHDLDQVIAALSLVLKFNIPQRVYARLLEYSTRNQLSAMGVLCELAELYRPSFDEKECMRVVEKTPGHVFHMDEIVGCLPSARFINIVRDPRDVVSSLMGMPTAKSASVLNYANSWNECLEVAGRFENRYPGKLLSIRYEDLVMSPVPVMRKVCDFLDLTFHSSMISDFVTEYNTCVLPHEVWKEEIKTGKISNKCGAWRSRITRGQAWLVEQATHCFMKVCGYDSDADPTYSEKLEAIEGEYKTINGEDGDKESRIFFLRNLTSIHETLNTPTALSSMK